MSRWSSDVAADEFGVRLDQASSWAAVRTMCERFLDDGRSHSVFTPNPEILLYARKHPDYASVLNRADMALPDGFGIAVVHLLRRRAWMRRWAGIEVAELVVRLAAERGLRVMFLGGRNDVAARAASRWRAELPGLEVMTEGNDVLFGEDGMAAVPGVESELDARIVQAEPAVILVCLGHPKQERWIDRHRSRITSARIMMGVGGTLDMWGGRFSRAPRWLRSVGLEWSWRLAQDPGRLPRTLRATIEFPFREMTTRRGGRRGALSRDGRETRRPGP